MEKFSEYMNKWLYGEDGYYTKYKSIGKEGDFFTSVSVSSFFGGTIAKAIVDSVKKGELKENSTVLEIGAHHGYLLADIIQYIFTLEPKLLTTLKFAIVERFDSLKKRQVEYLQNSFGDAIKVIHYSDINEVKLDSAYIIANEIYDAFACELIYTKDSIRKQAFIQDEKIEFFPCEDKHLNHICDRYKIEKGEVAIGYEEFAKEISDNIGKFILFTFDYGDRYPRNDFSTRVYKNHQVFPIFDESLNIKEFYKKSDITFDVNFSHVIDSFKSQDIDDINYLTQYKFLIDFGILELLEILKKNVSEDIYLRETQKVKMLIEPTGMGDRFKALIVKRL